MVLNISFSPTTEAKLREQAQISGKPVEHIIREAIETWFESRPPSVLTPDERLRIWNEWVASHPRREGVSLDDSRDSIYAGRDE
jgi:hypothetical protein